MDRTEEFSEASVEIESISYEALFLGEFRSVVAAAYRILGDRDGAVDVAEEAFTRLAQHWSKVSQYDRPGAWVRTVAIRLAIQNRFHRYRESQQYEPLAVVNPPEETAMLVRKAVMQLPRTQRAAVVLHYFDDLSIEQIAEIMSCRSNTVKAHLYKARAKLRTLLTGVFSDE